MTEDDIQTRLTEFDLKMFSVKNRTKNTLPQFIFTTDWWHGSVVKAPV